MLICGGSEPSLLMIKRADHPRDPWSGHMAFPGGKIDPSDPSPLAAAIREVKEEMGLVLSESDLVTPLSPRYTMRRGHRHQMFVSPYVFYLNEKPQLYPNGEVAQVTYIPLFELIDPTRYTEFEFTYEQQTYLMPCFKHELGRVWGLSLHFVNELSRFVAHLLS